jgi:hypothetical protein
VHHFIPHIGSCDLTTSAECQRRNAITGMPPAATALDAFRKLIILRLCHRREKNQALLLPC